MKLEVKEQCKKKKKKTVLICYGKQKIECPFHLNLECFLKQYQSFRDNAAMS